jgi:SHS2 domain-containing protein
VAEAVLALVGGFADTAAATVSGTVVAQIVDGDDETLLVAALDEVVCLVDTEGVVPVTVATEPVAGGLRLLLGVTDLAQTASTGPAPKGVTRSALRFGPTATGWSCEVTVDV